MRRAPGAPLSLFAFQDIITATTGILILLTLWMTMFLTAQRGEPAEPVAAPRPSDLPPREVLQNLVASRRAEADQLASRLTLSLSTSAAEVQSRLDGTKARRSDLQRRISAEEVKSSRSAAASLRQAEQELHEARTRMERLLAEKQRLDEELVEIGKSDRLYYNFHGGAGSVPWLLDVRGDRLLVARAGTSEPPTEFSQKQETARLREFGRWLNGLDRDDRYFVVLVRPSGVRFYGSLDSSGHLRPLLDQAGAEVGIDLLKESQTVIDPLTGAGR